MRKISLLLVFFSFNASVLFAQQAPPSTDIFVYQLKEKKGKLTIADGINITKRKGYDNQPAFFNNDYVMYTSDLGGQTDILIYDLYEESVKNITKSPTSEYSAYPIPGFTSFAVVKVEDDGRQRLWMQQMDKNLSSSIIIEKVEPVGYFAWNSKQDILMFVLGDPISLVLANAQVVDDKLVTSDVGRTIKVIPGSDDFAFERTEEDGSIMIYRLDHRKREFSPIIKKPNDFKDWTITQEGTFLSSKGSKLYMFNPKYHSDWQELTDLGSVASKGITRMTVSQQNDKIALVINQ